MIHFRYLFLAAVLILTTSFGLIHHGWANYDQKKVLDFKTIIEESIYENPHALLKVKFREQMWTVYLAPTMRMTDRGLIKEMLPEGTPVRIIAYPHKTVKTEMRAERIFVGGKKYELR